MKKLLIVLIFYVTINIGYCQTSNNIFRLGEIDLKKVIFFLEEDTLKSNNFHLVYENIFNDSIFIISIYKNDVLADRERLPFNYFSIGKGHVFEYDNILSKQEIKKQNLFPRHLLSKNGHPLFVVDSPYWEILIIRTKNNLIFYKMELMLLPSKNKSVDMSEKLDIY